MHEPNGNLRTNGICTEMKTNIEKSIKKISNIRSLKVK